MAAPRWFACSAVDRRGSDAPGDPGHSVQRHRAAKHGAGNEGGVFDDANAARLAAADAEHWWFRNKATFVSLLIRRFSSGAGWLVDVGAGSGGVTAMLGWPPDRTLALDGNMQLVKTSSQRHAMMTVVCDAASVPVCAGAANVVCALDVIEHVADPGALLREVARFVAADGCVIVSVPAHPWLWSDADDLLGHVRRYTRRALRRDLERSGLEVVWISHVFSWLTLPVLLRRRKGGGNVEHTLGLDASSPLIEWASMGLTRVEALVIRWVSLPFGTSVLCVARRKAGRRDIPVVAETMEVRAVTIETKVERLEGLLGTQFVVARCERGPSAPHDRASAGT